MKKQLLIAIFSLTTAFATGQGLNLLGHLSYSVTTAGVWHYVDSLNNEYALVGARDRVSIVNVSNPTNPVEVFNVPALNGQTSLWRELKTYKNYAYAVSEGGGGVIIINLTYLPDSISYSHWYGDSTISGQLQSAHTIAAHDGYLYIFGSNINSGGCIIADISNPEAPHFVGEYETNYIHDGYIRNDTLWAGEIYAGQFSVIDVSNKSNPQLLTTQQTPGQFCHNVWLSDNSNFAFTTDEVGGAPLGSFDVSNISNIQLETVYFTDSIPMQEVHNVRVLNDYLINPSYGSQITIVDAARPDNLIEIARAPTDFGSGNPYLCWDASPYLPSGNIIVTDTYGGLFVFGPNYQRACYLEGTVTDSLTGNLLNNVLVEIVGTPKYTNSDLNGIYKTGLATGGTFDVRFSKTGYITKTYSGIVLNSGVLTTIAAELVPFSAAGQVTSSASGNGLANVNVVAVSGATTLNATTDANGNFLLTNIVAGTYTVTAAAWGYNTACTTVVLNGSNPVSLQLAAGYQDDFSTDNNWTVSSTASSGDWVRVVPIGTTSVGVQANPANDIASDCSNRCFVTGNGAGTPNQFDLDDGTTILTSPVFDLSGYTDPYINYWRWYFNAAGIPAANIDTLFIYLNNGTTEVLIDEAFAGNTTMGFWTEMSLRIANYLTPTSTMTVKVVMSDKAASGNICEGGFDNFSITEGTTSVAENNQAQFQVYPNPASDHINVNINAAFLTENTVIKITDAAGRQILSQHAVNGMIRLPKDLSAGIYIISLEGTPVAVSPVRLVIE
jgi:choice-of-anchor B domain-containing protein